MKSYLPFLSLLLVLTSCTSLYKSGQTPDDVYYSPSPVSSSGEEYVSANKEDDRSYHYQNQYSSDYSGLTDNYYSYNPFYFSTYNNCLLYSNPFYNSFYSNYWNSYGYGNYYYNPSYAHVVIINPTPINNRPRMFNLNVYNNPNSANSLRNFGPTPNNSRGNNRGSGSNSGNFLRNVFNNSGSGGTVAPRSYTPSNSGSSNMPARSSSSGSGGGSAPVRRF